MTLQQIERKLNTIMSDHELIMPAEIDADIDELIMEIEDAIVAQAE